MTKKLLALLLAVMMSISLIPAVNAENTAGELTAAEKAARIEDLLEFSGRIKEMTHKHEPADAKNNADDPFANARIIVKSNSKLEYDGALAYVNGYNDWHIIQYATADEARKAAEIYENTKGVQYAEPDMIMSIAQVQGENDFLSWGFGDEYVNAFNYNEWLYEEMGSDIDSLPTITVAVIDTGADSDHEFLEDRLVPGFDFVNNDSNPEDDHHHGTHVSGTVVDGTLPNVKIMPLKCLDADGYGDTIDIISAMEYAYLNDCQVANLSLRGYCGDLHQAYVEVIDAGFNAGTVYCVASGNDEEDAMNYCPGNVERAITVAAHDQNKMMAYFSNTGKCVDITAPGVSILSARIGGGYMSLDGTSMATPHVAAAAAMLKSYQPDMSPDAVVEIIKTGASSPILPGGGVGLLCMTDILKFAHINTEGSHLNFNSFGEYAWATDDTSAFSTNSGINNSVSALNANAYLGAYQVISFEYKISTEENHDYFRFTINGETMLETSGSKDWQVFTCIVPGGGEKEFVWEFSKNMSGSAGLDKVWIRNVVVEESLSSVLNVEGSELYLETNGQYPWIIDESINGAKSGNTGVNNSTSVLTASADLSINMSLKFQYRVSGGSGDVFKLIVNGETVYQVASTSGMVDYEYTIPEDGHYIFEFVFEKDNSGASGEDAAWVKNIELGNTLESALNVGNGTLQFDSVGSYPWEVYGGCAKSTNNGIHSSSSIISLVIDMEAGDTITFDYKVSSEMNYDKFWFSVNGSQELEKSGQLDWMSFTFVATESRSYTFEWKYVKDYSASSGDDCAYLDNIVVERINQSGSGDADGNGNVDVQDALITMRYAMGLADENVIDLAASDTDGNGAVNAQDALMIMRIGMGLS